MRGRGGDAREGIAREWRAGSRGLTVGLDPNSEPSLKKLAAADSPPPQQSIFPTATTALEPAISHDILTC